MDDNRKFKLNAKYSPSGDQPAAIKQLVNGVNANYDTQTLLGITGSGKTFTIANVIEQVQKPTLIISHNKTLAAQLYNEFKELVCAACQIIIESDGLTASVETEKLNTFMKKI